MLAFPPLVFLFLASQAHCKHPVSWKFHLYLVTPLLKNISGSPLSFKPDFKPSPSCYLALSDILSNALSYSCAHKSKCLAGWTPLRHWISVYSFFPDPCSWLGHLSLWISKPDPSFNAHILDLSNNTAHIHRAPTQNFPYPHGFCLAPCRMLPCITIWWSIYKVLRVGAMPYASLDLDHF